MRKMAGGKVCGVIASLDQFREFDATPIPDLRASLCKGTSGWRIDGGGGISFQDLTLGRCVRIERRQR